jgi:hypothetical protein
MAASTSLHEAVGWRLEEMDLMLKTYMPQAEVVLEAVPVFQEQDLTVEMVVFREGVAEVAEPEVLPADQEETVDTEESS